MGRRERRRMERRWGERLRMKKKCARSVRRNCCYRAQEED